MNLPLAAMCQGARLMNMSQRDERNLESYFQKLGSENGYEYVISKLKVLKEHSIRKLEDPNSKYQFEVGEPSIHWNRRLDSPKGPLSVIYKTWKNPESRIRGIGMLINTITLDQVSDKQLDKLLSGVNSHSEDCDGKVILIDPGTVKSFAFAYDRSRRSQPVFSGLDLTGSLLPYGNFDESIAEDKRNLTSADPSKRHKAIADLSHAVDGQWIDTPPIVFDFLKKEFPSYSGVKLRRPKGVIARDYEYSSKLKTYGRHINDYYAGTASLLQKPGGKLRTVYNTNRVINTAMKPYADGLVAAFYHRNPHNVFVERQDKGMEAVQQMLKRGHTLVSADLSSATDYLNPRPFYNGLCKGLCDQISFDKEKIPDDKKVKVKACSLANQLRNFPDEEYRALVYDGLDNHYLTKDSEVYAHAMRGVDLFRRVAEMPFYSKDLNTAIGLRSGQPLGMMGSFQTLTAMNFLAGKQACEQSLGHFDPEIPQFVTVGDDFVGDKSIMDSYSAIISSWGGVDNHEKALQSSRYAEFLSHLITRDHIIPMKPKFHLGHQSLWLNAQKSTVHGVLHTYRLNQSDKQALEALASIGDPQMTYSGAIGTSSRLSKDNRLLIESALRSLSLIDDRSADPIKVSDETSRLTRVEQHTDEKYLGTELDRRTYQLTDKGKVFTGIARARLDHEDDLLTTAVDHYDHKRSERVPNQGVKAANDSIRKQAYLAKDLISAINGDKEAGLKSHKLPFHTSTSISNNDLLQQAKQLQDRQGLEMNEQSSPFPSVRSNRSRKNLVDRSRIDQDNGLDPLLLADQLTKALSDLDEKSEQADSLTNKLTTSLEELEQVKKDDSDTQSQ